MSIRRAKGPFLKYRPYAWVAAVPVIFFLGLESSVAVVFLYSTYANFTGDKGVWQAWKARQEQTDKVR